MSDGQTVVGSTVYNLAGGPSQRQDYLKSLILGGITAKVDSLGTVLTKGYQHSPAQRIRAFLQWARKDPSFLAQFGITSGTLLRQYKLNYTVIQTELADQVSAGQGVQVISASTDDADVRYWVLRFLALKYGGAIPAYSYTYDAATNTITLQYEAGGGSESFTPNDYVNDSKFMYVNYHPIDRNILQDDLNVEPLMTVPAGENFPSLDGWTQDSLTNPVTTQDVRLFRRVDITYSDNRTPVSIPEYLVSTKSASATESHGSYHQDVPQGALPGNPDSSVSVRVYQVQDLVYEIKTKSATTVTTRVIAGGVVETTTTVQTQEYLAPKRTYQNSTRTLINWIWLPAQWFIYQEDSGRPALDAMFGDTVTSSMDKYYPPIPFRFENSAVTDKGSAWHIELPFPWIWPAGDELWIAHNAEQTGSAIRVRFVQNGDYTHADGQPWPYYVVARETGERLNNVLDGDQTSALYAPVAQVVQAGVKGPWTRLSALPRSTVPTFNGENPLDLSYLYPACKKAFKKAFDTKYDKIQNQLLENVNLDDIDYGYTVFGVPINVKDRHSRKYIYKFFKTLMDSTSVPNEEEEWLGEIERTQEDRARHHEDGVVATFPKPPTKTLEIQSNHTGVINYKTRLNWSFITEAVGSGLLQKPTEIAAGFECWFISLDEEWWLNEDQVWIAPSVEQADEAIRLLYVGETTVVGNGEAMGTSGYKIAAMNQDWAKLTEILNSGSVVYEFRGTHSAPGWRSFPSAPVADSTTVKWDTATVAAKVGDMWWKEISTQNLNLGIQSRVELYWQETTNSWRKLVISDLVYNNFVYKNHAIFRSVNDEIKKYAESDFIIPLQDDILHSLSIVDQAQVASSCCLMVLNSYEIVQKKWYQEDWFQVVMFGMTVIIAVALAFFSGGSSLGLLGTALEVGTALGLSGTAAILVGAAINTLAAIILGKVLGMMTTGLLKDAGAIGTVISGIFSLVLSVGLNNAGDFSQLWNLVSTPEGVMSLVSCLGSGVDTYLAESQAKIQKDLEDLLKKNSARVSELQTRFEEEFGKNPLDLSLINKFINEVTETPRQFLDRTLLTGSDIVSATLDVIPNFVEYNLRLKLLA